MAAGASAVCHHRGVTTRRADDAVDLDDLSSAGAAALALLDAVVAEAGGEPREGQRQMTAAVAEALTRRRHLVVEAPTGTGKTWALAAAAATWLADRRDDDHDDRVIITTATRALQDQLVTEDLPRVAPVAEASGVGFSWAVLKGRSNYLCLAAVDAAAVSLLAAATETATRLADAADAAGDGERTVLPDVGDDEWRRLSSTADECPGARSCSHGETCWAERARHRAAGAEVVVVNTALYAAHLLSDGEVLPAHGAVIVDEAHALPDVLTGAGTVTVAPGRLRNLERATRTWADAVDGRKLLAAADGLAEALGTVDGVVDADQGDVAVHLATASAAARGILRRTSAVERDDDAARAAATAGAVINELASFQGSGPSGDGDGATATPPGDDRVVWVERGALHSAPIEVAALARASLWPDRTVVCTSGTLRSADAAGRPTFAPYLASVGAPASTRQVAVDSPFDHHDQGLLYVPKGRIPSPKEPGWAEGVADELWGLAVAAGGRTLALFTSRAGTERAAESLRARVEAADDEAHGAGLEVLTQWDASRQRLVEALLRRRRVVLCATRSFWTGIDLPGDACVVVAIDRLPFARPDDPVARARRDRVDARGGNAFVEIDVPLAATQLAQGVGRLIRSPEDRGVVAVLDTRLATARWRRQILGALPPLRRTVDPEEVAAFLAGA